MNKNNNNKDYYPLTDQQKQSDYNPLLLHKKLKLKKQQKGITQNLTSPEQRLAFKEYVRKKMKIDKDLVFLMHELWFRKRRTRHDKPYIGDYYAEAFEKYLFRNKIPKLVPRVERQTTKLLMTDKACEDLNSLEKIALKRQQSFSSIIEQALREYLDEPENYLGENYSRKDKVGKI